MSRNQKSLRATVSKMGVITVLGAGIGTAVGSAIGNVSMGVGAGAILGVALGALLAFIRRREPPRRY